MGQTPCILKKQLDPFLYWRAGSLQRPRSRPAGICRVQRNLARGFGLIVQLCSFPQGWPSRRIRQHTGLGWFCCCHPSPPSCSLFCKMFPTRTGDPGNKSWAGDGGSKAVPSAVSSSVMYRRSLRASFCFFFAFCLLGCTAAAEVSN